MAEYPGKGKVAVLKTTPRTILQDTEKVMRLAGVDKALPKNVTTGLKINISWQTWYPACSSTPWQLEGAIRTLQKLGYQDLVGIHNDTVVVDTSVGEANNKHRFVTDNYGVPCVYLYNENFEWERYTPKAHPFLVLDKVYPDGVYIPKSLVGKNIVHLPTVKTHVFTTITGAMKNAFGGLLHRNRHWTHSVIHETLVDLLMIQQEIHPGIFALMDGTFAGDGPGPRAMRWHEKNILLASADQVAIDAVSAKLQGFDPMTIPLSALPMNSAWGLATRARSKWSATISSRSQPWNFVQDGHLCLPRTKIDLPRPAQTLRKYLLFKARWCPGRSFASNFYHNVYWYPFVGRKRVQEALKTHWGQLFASYGDGHVAMPGMEPKTVVQAAAGMSALAVVAGGLLWFLSRNGKKKA